MKKLNILLLLATCLLMTSCFSKTSGYEYYMGYLCIRNRTDKTIIIESDIQTYDGHSREIKLERFESKDIAGTRQFFIPAVEGEFVSDLRIEDFIVNYDSAQVSAYYENENGERELIYTWTYASRNDDSIKQLFNLDDSEMCFDNIRDIGHNDLFEMRYRFYITYDMLPKAE